MKKCQVCHGDGFNTKYSEKKNEQFPCIVCDGTGFEQFPKIKLDLIRKFQTNEWVPLNEVNQPELGLAVLVYISSGLITVGYRKSRDIWQLFGDVDSIVDINKSQVTHYRYLPDAPF